MPACPQPMPFIAPELQEGTTPLVKYLEGKLTRTFKNYHQPAITEKDYSGSRVIRDNHYKLVIDGEGENAGIELFKLSNDRAEERNIVDAEPEVVEELSKRLRQWQTSVLHSLTEADYK